jgi:hypothetical protein
MTAREQEEYSALRTTIRERGTTRVWIFLVGIIAWGALTTATAALASSPLAVLLPLLILGATFEAVYALHVGVERIGRYLQVFYERDDDERGPVPDTREHRGEGASGAGVAPRASNKWEHVAMSFGRPAGAIGLDALFSIVFLIATLFNFAPALVTNPIAAEVVFIGGAHVLFILRVIVARAAAARQRTVDLARFQELKPGR